MPSSSTILHKRNSNPGVVPSTSSLSAGEIAVNTADGKLFTKTADNAVKTFLNAEQQPYTLDTTLSSSNYQYGANNVTGLLAGVLGGVNNDVSGAGSTVINGSDNDIDADYALIGNGSNNTILTGGDFGAILGGVNNTLNHSESFILGSNITSHLSGFTYVNNLTAVGKIYGDGSELTGLTVIDASVRSLTSNWDSAYTIIQTNSAINWNYQGTDIKALTGKYENVSTTVQTNSALWSSVTDKLPLSGGVLTGSLEVSGTGTAVLYSNTSGQVGVNTESPNQALTVIGGISATGIVYVNNDIEITDFTKGVILRSPNNSRWRLTITNSGALSTVAL